MSKCPDSKVSKNEEGSGGGFRTPAPSASKSLDRNAFSPHLNSRTASTTNSLPTDPPPPSETGDHPSGIRTHAPHPPIPSESGRFPPPLNTPTVQSTVSLPHAAGLCASCDEVRSAAGALRPNHGAMRTSELMREVAFAMAPLAQDASPALAAEYAALQGELRARAWALELVAEAESQMVGPRVGADYYRAAWFDLLQAIGEVRP